MTRVFADGDVELSAHYPDGRMPKGAESTIWFDRLNKRSIRARLRKLPKAPLTWKPLSWSYGESGRSGQPTLQKPHCPNPTQPSPAQTNPDQTRPDQPEPSQRIWIHV